MMAHTATQSGVELSLLLAELILDEDLKKIGGVKVNGVVDDHRTVNPGYLFVAHQGEKSHGLLHADAASRAEGQTVEMTMSLPEMIPATERCPPGSFDDFAIVQPW